VREHIFVEVHAARAPLTFRELLDNAFMRLPRISGVFAASIQRIQSGCASSVSSLHIALDGAANALFTSARAPRNIAAITGTTTSPFAACSEARNDDRLTAGVQQRSPHRSQIGRNPLRNWPAQESKKPDVIGLSNWWR
jgi:hypothetical protein